MKLLGFTGVLCLLSHIDAQHILDIVHSDPELSTLSKLIAGTGAGLPNPDIEDRFEIRKPGLSYTFLAPTNDAFEHVPKAVLTQLSLPQNYPLLLSLIRNHLIEHSSANPLLNSTHSNQTVTSVEGTPLLLVSSSDAEVYISVEYYKARIVPKGTKTFDGAYLHKITRLIDPYGSVYGVSWPTGKPTTINDSPRQWNQTMTDLVQAEPSLKTWLGIMNDVLPAILKRLGDRRGPEGKACRTPFPFAMFPANSAFDQLPVNYTKLLRAPFNFALSSHLLAWGITVPSCNTFDDIMLEIKKRGRFQVFSHRADINLTITEASPKGSGELMVNNARVTMANKCAGNGCIWIIDRFIDPVFGFF